MAAIRNKQILLALRHALRFDFDVATAVWLVWHSRSRFRTAQVSTINEKGVAYDLGERETIAAYVSGKNACRYCYGAHKDVAGRFGVDSDLVEALMKDIETAPVADKFRVLLQYVGKLTTAPTSLTQRDADAVYAAGWSPDALYDAVAVCALFNFMNRIVEGTGVEPIPDEIRATMPRPPKEMTYSDLLDMMDQFRK
jgi:uncharacterized peroxidase-related enzyme